MSPANKKPETLESVRARLAAAEAEYRRALTEDYIARLIRDDAIVEAHRSGLSSREISEIVGDIGQPNVVRARRRAATRRDAIPGGLLSPADAVRQSGLSPAEFVGAVREGRIVPVELEGGVRAFRPEDIDQLSTGPTDRSRPKRAASA
jgi:DNA-binding transcriptional ArsR family regulator